MTVKSINNRQIQSTLKPYKTKSEISEALFLLRDFLNVSSYKWLSHFIHTDHGVTQAKISTICELSGVSKSSFYAVVRPELNSLFAEPIIKTIKAPEKLDRSRTKKVRASEFKVLQPLKKIKYLIERFLRDQESELRAFFAELDDLSGLEPGPEPGPESDAEKPRQDSAETDFPNEQNKSFRENLSEKDINKLNITDLFVVKNFGKIKIKNAVKNYLNTFPLFRDFMSWTESKRYEIAKTIQLAIIKTKTDIEEKKPQYMIKNAIARFMAEYADKPKSEFLRLLYTFVFNSLKNDQEDDSEPSEDDSEIEEPTPGTWEALKPTFRRLLDEKPKSDLSHEEKKAEIERMLKQLHGEDQEKPPRDHDLDDLGVY